nr:MAG TPA: hypothetical protein [Caudoviricetes sp.]
MSNYLCSNMIWQCFKIYILCRHHQTPIRIVI